MKKNLTKIFSLLMLIALSLSFTAPVLAQSFSDYNQGGAENINIPIDDSDTALTDTVVSIINIVLGLLALIAVIIVLIGGFEWMTAGGDDGKVATAKKRLQYGLTGLVIIFLAYIIVRFVIGQLTTIL